MTKMKFTDMNGKERSNLMEMNGKGRRENRLLGKIRMERGN